MKNIKKKKSIESANRLLRVNVRTAWEPCLKNDSDISCTSSYEFSWNLEKVLPLPHIQRKSLNGLASSVQLEIKMFLETVLLVDEPVSKVEKRFTGTQQGRRYQIHMASCHTMAETDNAPKLTEQCQSYGISIYCKHAMQICHGCLQRNFILYFIFIVLSFSFLLFSSIIVFYTSLEVIKLAFLENKSRSVCCIFANFILPFETKS